VLSWTCAGPLAQSVEIPPDDLEITTMRSGGKGERSCLFEVGASQLDLEYIMTPTGRHLIEDARWASSVGRGACPITGESQIHHSAALH
jgi:hypothetical protein